MAHSTLVSASPARNSSNPTSPLEVKLVFDDELIAVADNANIIIVRSGSQSGPQVDLGNSAVNGSVLTVGLPTLSPGSYFVTYRIVSNDGHPVTSDYQFSVSAQSSPVPTTGGSSNKVLAVKKTIAKSRAAKDAGLAMPNKATVTLAVASSSKKFCKVSGSKLVGVKVGNCKITVTVSPKSVKGKPKPKKSSGTVTYQVK